MLYHLYKLLTPEDKKEVKKRKLKLVFFKNKKLLNGDAQIQNQLVNNDTIQAYLMDDNVYADILKSNSATYLSRFSKSRF